MKRVSGFIGLLLVATNCLSLGWYDDFYREKNQRNKYFVVDRKNVDYLTPATVLSLRAGNVLMVDRLVDYLPTLCVDFSWMRQPRILYIFEDSKYAAMFDSFGVENIAMQKPVDKFVAVYHPEDRSLTLYPLLQTRRTVYMVEGWCQ